MVQVLLFVHSVATMETKRTLSGQILTALKSKNHVTKNDTVDAKLRQQKRIAKSTQGFHHLQRIREEEIVFYKDENESTDPFPLGAKKDGCFRRLLMSKMF